MQEKMLNSGVWCKVFDIPKEDILDPDGWDRRNFNKSWLEDITKDEFIRRLTLSTIHVTTGNIGKLTLKYIHDQKPLLRPTVFK